MDSVPIQQQYGSTSSSPTEGSSNQSWKTIDETPEWLESAGTIMIVALVALAAIIVIGGALTAFVFTCIYLPKTAITVTCLAILILLELACT